ncbi:MAG: SDR family oxidoreductase [Phycisphaerae bacterium]
MPKYLVTGGAGFIGSHLVEHLVRAGESIRVIDNFITGKRANLEPFAGRAEVLEADLRRPADCARACDGVEVVLHQAALPSVPKSVADPATSHDCNISGSLNLLMAARQAGVRRVVLAASSSAYGNTPTQPKVESMRSDPLSPYAVQKLAAELYARAFSECYGIQTISLRYFNVFGPRQDPTSQYAAAIPAFVTSILRNEPPTVYGDGEQTRDFTYIDNVVAANLAAAAAPRVSGEVCNIACGEAVSVNHVIRRINELLGKSVQPKYVPSRAGDVKHSLADIGRARELIGYQPKVRFDEGLKRSIEWYSAAAQ